MAPSLVCAWTLSVGDGDREYRQRILPDGCADIIWIGDADPIVVGPMTRSVMSCVAPGTRLLGLRFRPGHVASILGVPADELVDRELPLRDLWPRWAVDVSEQLRARQSMRAKLSLLDTALAARQTSIAPPDPLVTQALASLVRDREEGLDRLAKRLGISDRQLRRRFTAATGYGPKTLQGIVRFQRLLALANEPARRRRLDDLAMAAGYADQSHMTRDVRRFAGVTPTALLGRVESALILSDLIEDRSRHATEAIQDR